MTRPLRIFHLIKSLGRGGAEMLLADGPRISDPAAFTYGFGYFLAHKNALVPDLERQFGNVTCFPAKGGADMLRQVPRLASHLRSWKADVLHCHLPLAGVIGRLAGKLANVPVVYTEHNVLERYHRATRLAARATWRLQRRVIAVSADVRDSITRNLGDSVPVQVVLNGVSVDRFTREQFDGALARRELGIPPGANVVGSVAVFRKQKRLDLWLAAAAQLAARDPSLRFLLVGDGPERANVEKLIAQAGLGSKVILPGLRAEVRPLLAAMDVYLMSSDFEGIPIALLEAMAMQVAPVVTDAGGIPELVENGRQGLLLRRGDVDGLVAAATQLLNDDQRRRQYGEAARRRVAEHFSTQRMMGELEEVYRSVAGT